MPNSRFKIQHLGQKPQFNIAVQGQTGAQPEGAFLNFILRERQEQMEEDVKRAWKVDPLLNRTISVQSEKPPRKQLKTKQ
jgi:hypothetical protein